MTGSAYQMGPQTVPANMKPPKDFCPRCVGVRKWTVVGNVKTCQTCGLKIKLG